MVCRAGAGRERFAVMSAAFSAPAGTRFATRAWNFASATGWE